MYLVNESSKLEPVNRVYKIREKSQSLLDHPRKILKAVVGNVKIKTLNHISNSRVLLKSTSSYALERR